MTEEENTELTEEEVAEVTASEENWEAQASEFKDKMLRMAAESQNMRRRYEKQIEDARDYSVVSFAKDLVSVMDNLSRALEHLPKEMDETTKNFVLGVEMTKAELARVFAKHGITSVEPTLGDKFDYNLHTAMLQAPTDEHEPGTVLQLMQIGYKLKDRLLRPAAVSVSKGL
jgi:molecular chaperone GrpE